MTNKEMVNIFVRQGKGRAGRGFSYEMHNDNKTILSYGNVIYSYGYHYPLGYIDLDSEILYINEIKSTRTTQKHKGLLKRAGESAGLAIRYFNASTGIFTDTENGEVINER